MEVRGAAATERIEQPAIVGDELLGRTSDVDRVLEAIAAPGLVSLVGVGGVGKTRLALEVLDRITSRGERAIFIDLTSRTDAASITTDLGVALGMPDPDAAQAPDIVSILDREPRILVVLDNLEQIRDAGPVVRALAGDHGATRVLATSRIALGVHGERVLHLGPLVLPATNAEHDVLTAPASALFLRRARQVGRLSILDERTAAEVADVCRRLDGLPLAIELAAARTRLLSPGAIARRLSTGDPTLLAGQAPEGFHGGSMHAVLQWTVELLGEEDRRVLDAVSFCDSPFDLEMAADLCPGASTLDALEHLVALSLVQHQSDADGEPRLRLLEVVRGFCRTRIPARDLELLGRRHATAMADTVRREEEALLSTQRATATARLGARLDDLRSAFDRMVGVDPSVAIGLIAPVWRFWAAIGRRREAIHRLRQALLVERPPTTARGWALAGLAGLLHDAEGHAATREAADEALRIARRFHDRRLELEVLPAVVLGAIDRRDEQAARKSARRFVAAARAAGDRRALVRALATFGLTEGTFGNHAAGVRWLQDAVEVARQEGDRLNEAIQLTNLADLELDRRRWRDALVHATAAVAILRGLDSGPYLAPALCDVGQSLAELGRLDDSRATLREAGELLEAAEGTRVVAVFLMAAMPYFSRIGAEELAARAWACVLLMAASGDIALTPGEQQGGRRLLAATAERLGEQSLRAAVQAGEVADPMVLVREIRDLLEHGAGTRGVRRTPSEFVLTNREAEVLRLLGEGLSDQQLGERLGISPKTASVHVANIKGKLAVATRLEAAIVGRALADVGAAGFGRPSGV